MEIKKLEKLITRYSNQYYTGKPTISDAEFDALVDKLREKAPQSPLLSTTGWGFKETSDKVAHKFEVKGLEKVQYENVNRQFNVSTNLKPRFVVNSFVEPKLDGLTFVAYYDFEGNLEYVLTRGDGTVGKNITKHTLHLVPKKIPLINKWTAIRGELFLPNGHRSKASGIINKKTVNDDRFELKALVYDTIFCDKEGNIVNLNDVEKVDNLADYLIVLGEHNLFIDIYQTPLNYTFKDKLQELFNRWGERYPIDGLVVRKLNKDNKYYKIAVKFPQTRYQTILRKVEWNISDYSKYSPVAIFDPIEIDNTIVSKATLHNIDYIEGLNLKIGSQIDVIKANQIIPKIVGCRDIVGEPTQEIVPPSYCVKCGSKTLIEKEINTKVVRCSNYNCTARKDRILLNLFKLNAGKGLADTTLRKFIGEFGIKLINLEENIHVFSDNTTHTGILIENMFDSIKRSNLNLEYLLKIVSPEKMGQATIQKLVDKYKNIDEFMYNLVDNGCQEVLNKGLQKEIKICADFFRVIIQLKIFNNVEIDLD